MNIADELKQGLTADELCTVVAAIRFTMRRIVEGSKEHAALQKLDAALTDIHFRKLGEEEIAKN